MTEFIDGPASPLFTTLKLSDSAATDCGPEAFRLAAAGAPTGECVAWGIPFGIDRCRFVDASPATFTFDPQKAPWLVIAHTADKLPDARDERGFPSSLRGTASLGAPAARYVFLYEDGEELPVDIRLRYQLGHYKVDWGQGCFEAASFIKPHPVRAHHEQMQGGWGWSQCRTVNSADWRPWVTWLWAWQNPRPRADMRGIRIEPLGLTIALSGITAGHVREHPLRWDTRKKAVFSLPEGRTFDPHLDERGLLSQIRLDLGQIISAHPRKLYPNEQWPDTPEDTVPSVSEREVLIEYTAHPEAHFHLDDERCLAAESVARGVSVPLRPVAPSTQRVALKVVIRGTTTPIPVKLHVHGEAGEHLSPVDRHRIVNTAFMEDYSVDYSHLGLHDCTYIPGRTVIDLPLGRVYIEITKGFEIKPIRRLYEITTDTTELTIELDKVLDWRERGWVTADTHVHFLSTGSALIEGAGEGVNIVNLLASQWGEMMTSVGDFDAQSALGARTESADGEYIVRVGTENRQCVLGHISLLGYEGSAIAPMTTGGPEESALGDPVESLLTEWARQCKAQQGVVVLPHFPNPRAEHAAAVVQGAIDAVEMTAWGDRYAGINPYSLVDWYRFLNCGYMTAAVAGTDKMFADTAVGTIRTYALLDPEVPFTYDAWKEAVRLARTFVSYGPLLEFRVDGRLPGQRIEMDSSGGTVGVEWSVASVTMPMTRVELIVNGEVRESTPVAGDKDGGHWSVPLTTSSWLALLVRGSYPDKPEMIGAHSSPVVVEMEGSPFFAAADAVSILEQIEGSLAYLDTLGTRAETAVYKRMRLELTSAHRQLHNRMHDQGFMHQHTPTTNHPEHFGDN